MRTWYIPILCLCLFTMLGCNTTPYGGQTPAERREANAVVTTGYFDDAVCNGVIAQHTLYAYHFQDNAPQLNGLGERDLGILADYYKSAGGTLNVRQEGASPNLYVQRVQQVVAFLEAQGVDAATVTIVDAAPGGDGTTSERVVQVVSEENERRKKAKPSGSGSMISGGGK